MITVILNCYKRTQYLQEQIEAIKSQSIPPEDIWIWYNKPEDQEQKNLYDLDYVKGCKVITSNHNFKFHGRFSLGLLAKTKYVAFFDDDTIPGDRWFENCITTIDNGDDGILGTTGVILLSNSYKPNVKVGWTQNHNTIPADVDLVGHAWFMNKDYLRYLWYEEPYSWDNGEDIQLSFLAQKYGNVRTIVPPHPPEDHALWGSLPEKGSKYGNDSAATYIHTKSHDNLRDEIALSQINKGWKLARNLK